MFCSFPDKNIKLPLLSIEINGVGGVSFVEAPLKVKLKAALYFRKASQKTALCCLWDAKQQATQKVLNWGIIYHIH